MVRISISIPMLSFAAMVSSGAAYIAELFGYIKAEYANTIMATSLMVQAILMAALIRRVTKNPPAGGIVSRVASSISAAGVVIPKNRFNDKYVPGDKEILSHGIKTVHPWKDSMFTIVMELAPDTENRPLKFYIIRKYSNNEHEQGIDIVEPSDSLKHVFRLNIDPKELINFKFSRDATIKSFAVDELYVP